MLIVTTDGLAGYEIRSVLGEVVGTAVQTDQARPAPGASPSSGTFRVSTGEQQGIGLGAARREAVDRLRDEARRKGANTVVGMRFDTVALTGGGYEVCAYGTAVWVEAAQNQQPVREQAPQMQRPPGRPAPPPPYGDPQPSGPPMAARNLTMGLGDRPR